MAGLQRSSQTFRRSGSSGLVWDERVILEDQNQGDQRTAGELEDDAIEFKELRHSQSVGSIGLQRRRNDGAEYSKCNNGDQAFHTRCVPPSQDPPSPKAPGCIFCGIFRKAGPSGTAKPRRY